MIKDAILTPCSSRLIADSADLQVSVSSTNLAHPYRASLSLSCQTAVVFLSFTNKLWVEFVFVFHRRGFFFQCHNIVSVDS